MFTAGEHRLMISDLRFPNFFNSQIGVQMFGVHYSSAIYRAPRSARDGSGYAAKGRHRFKHEIITPSFVLFADNGIDHPCHSYGYAFGLPALFSTKITATFPILYA